MKTELFKRNTNGSVQRWTIEVESNKYRTHSGQYPDGKIVTSKWTTVKGKNIGRSNETSPEEQAILEATSKAERQREKGYRDDIKKIDSGLLFKPMLANKVKDVNTLPFPVLSQPKLDGIRCNCTKDGMFARSGKPILSAPHIWDQLEATGIWDEYPDAVFDGELYSHELRDQFEKIISLARKSKPTEDDLDESHQLIEYHVYDMLLTPDMVDESWIVRNPRGIPLPPACKWVRTRVMHDVDQLNDEYAKYLEDGYEGQMIRLIDAPYEHKRSKTLLKRKEFIDEEYEIIRIVEGQGNRSGMAGRVVLFNHNPGDRSHLKDPDEFRAGIKGGEAVYIKMLKDANQLVGKRATIRYQNLSEYGVPRFPVCVAIRDYE